MKILPRYPGCFVCGRKNEAGLNVKFRLTDEGVETEYRAEQKHNSYAGILHGGIISALLDECIGWAVAVQEETMFVTGELKLQYMMPVPINKKIIVRGYFSENQVPHKKYRHGHGVIIDDDGKTYAKAEAKYFPIPKSKEKGIMDTLEIDDDPEKPLNDNLLWGK